ncbi:MAG: HEAT repeat domain-containing protein, partial [Gemmataceae bacterium]|nr:HEAT repeat domain-containing protein [Gemmataceae bacterium]
PGPVSPPIAPPAPQPAAPGLPQALGAPTPNGPPVAAEQVIVFGGRAMTAPRFPLHIPPTAKAVDLLPAPPKAAPAGPALTDDLTKVPEVAFAEQPDKAVDVAKRTEAAAHQLAKIAHLNAKKTDAFMTALLENRSDLAGLPFVMGDDCRTAGERARQFAAAVALVQQARGGQGQIGLGNFVVLTGSGIQPPAVPAPAPAQAPPAAPTGGFWDRFRALCDQQDAAGGKVDRGTAEHIALARIAALTQMLAADPAEVRAGLVKYLAGVSHVEATKHLARMAIFSPDDDVRLAAVDALKVRRERDYTDILVKGLSYPWPAVARRAADAVARLDRKDLVPELVAVLDSTDPRLPKTTGRGTFVRELVKLNHHRNCMMCHPSGQPGQVPDAAITAEVPVQGQSLPTPAQGYNRSSPDLMIRVDVTYLRTDFSATLTVPDAHPWPDAQRFDFVVRERELSAAESDAFEAKLAITEPGVVSPYHQAALAALREITGKDAAPTAAAWRELLKQKRTD